ncbi:MAG: hypothetical protein A2096_04935 [Spirochaetes bacterium GWF1_41_5]|nr:MAG: hypothetical protein A2096_04935 [Spirochaetes bacterium GWF1_41_5]HBE02286.1 hypothetical protein [Spirochaetia bacterium]
MAIIILLFTICLAATLLYFFIIKKKINFTAVDLLIEAKEYEKARKLLLAPVTCREFIPDAHFLQTKLLMGTKQYDFALVEIRNLLHQKKFGKLASRREVFRLLVQYFEVTGKTEEAVQFINSYEEFYKHDFYFIFTQASCHGLARHYDKSIFLFKKALLMIPDDINCLFQLGLMLFRIGHTEQAEKYFRDALAINKKHAPSRFYTGRIFLQNSMFDQALQAFTESSNDPQLKYKALYYCAQTYIQKQLNTNAMEMLNKIKTHFKKKAAPYENRLKEYQKCLSDKLYLDTCYQLAALYAESGNYYSALEEWEEIRFINPDFKDVQQNILAYAKYGRDRIQDYLVFSAAEFSEAAGFMLKKMGYDCHRLHSAGSSDLYAECSDQGAVKNNRTLVLFRRNELPFREADIIKFFDYIRSNSCENGAVVASGDFAADAVKFALDKPVILIGKNYIMKMLKDYEKHLAGIKKHEKTPESSVE